MKLTPLDIRKQEFTRAFRGYETTEVQAFLQTLSEQWQHLLDEQHRQAERIRELEAKLAHYQRIEEALQQALETARENAHQTLQQAERKAQLMLEEAQARAEEIHWRAEQERRQLQRRIAELDQRRDELIARLRAFLQAEMEVLNKFEARVLEEASWTSEAETEPAEISPATPEAPQEQPLPPQVEAVVSVAEKKDELERQEPSMVPRFMTFQSEPETPETPAERKGWTVRSIVGVPSTLQSPAAASSDPGSAPANEEVEKIRRILKNLE